MSCETAFNLVGLEKITQPTACSLRVMSSAMTLLDAVAKREEVPPLTFPYTVRSKMQIAAKVQTT
jgi:hypothetical protein